MSGGSMQYVYSTINDAADFIQRTLAEYELRRKKGLFIKPCEYRQKENPDIEYLKTPEALTDALIERLEDCLFTVRKAAICAERVEWLTSCDDDESDFCIRLDDDIAKAKKTGGVQ